MESGTTKDMLMLLTLVCSEDTTKKITFKQMIGLNEVHYTQGNLIQKTILELKQMLKYPVYYKIEDNF